jgi:excisionase family DNA binding protein
MARKKTTIEAPVYYTTHQVAKHLGVSLPTVVNWVNAGLLRAHRTPGGHRRIAHQDVIGFARAHDYPVARELLQHKSARNKILIVDDEQDFSEMVREYLCARGDFEVEVANSGFRAGYVLARFKPDLVLMDLLMPDLDGLEVRRTLQQDPETQHVSIIATSSDSGSAMDSLREQHFEGYIEKPLVLDELLDLIRSVLREIS